MDTLNLQAGLGNGRYRVELFAHNLANERGISEYHSSGARNQLGLAAFIQPRTIGVQLRAKF